MTKEIRGEMRAVKRQMKSADAAKARVKIAHSKARRRLQKRADREFAKVLRKLKADHAAVDREARVELRSADKTMAALTNRLAVLEGRLAS